MISNNKFQFITLLLISGMTIMMTTQCVGNKQQKEAEVKVVNYQNDNLSVAYFAAGCFWCVEAVFESVKGVKEAVSGYSGGESEDPTYEQVGAGLTNHAESVAVYYDPKKVDFATLVKVFFGCQDPTTPNQQGPDRGRQYRSIAFYQSEAEKTIIEDYIKQLEKDKVFDGKIVTQVVAFTHFYEAEEYHQNYEKRNPNQSYVKAVSIPRLERFKAKFPELLK